MLCSVILRLPLLCALQLAEQLYQAMTKRFNTSLRTWVQYGHFLMRRSKLDAARSLLQRSLKSLTNKQQRKGLCYSLPGYKNPFCRYVDSFEQCFHITFHNNPGMPHLQYRKFSCRFWAPLSDDIITELA